MYSRILHAQDGSEGAFKASAEAIDIAEHYDAELHMISVKEVSHYPETVSEVIAEQDRENNRFQEAVRRSREMAEAAQVEIHPHILVGHEVKTILEFVKAHDFDLLVVGFMGHSALYDRLMGSTCQSLVRLVPCSVLVVK